MRNIVTGQKWSERTQSGSAKEKKTPDERENKSCVFSFTKRITIPEHVQNNTHDLERPPITLVPGTDILSHPAIQGIRQDRFVGWRQLSWAAGISSRGKFECAGDSRKATNTAWRVSKGRWRGSAARLFQDGKTSCSLMVDCIRMLFIRFNEFHAPRATRSSLMTDRALKRNMLGWKRTWDWGPGTWDLGSQQCLARRSAASAASCAVFVNDVDGTFCRCCSGRELNAPAAVGLLGASPLPPFFVFGLPLLTVATAPPNSTIPEPGLHMKWT